MSLAHTLSFLIPISPIIHVVCRLGMHSLSITYYLSSMRCLSLIPKISFLYVVSLSYV